MTDPAAPWLPAALFSPQDRAAAAAAPPLRVAVPQNGVAAHVEVAANGDVQGPQVQWLLAVGKALGLSLSPLLVADEAAALQALREGRADLALALQPPPLTGAAPGLSYSLGTGAQPLAWVVLREQRPLPLDRARIAHRGDAEAVVADRLRRRHPEASLLPQASAAAGLQAVVERRVDAYVGNLLPVLAALQQQALPGLELRQVWPGAAGHRHLVLRDDRAALLPALNKAIAAWRATTAPHRAVLRVAQLAAPQLRAPLALPADLVGADTAVMDRLLKPPYALSASMAERLPLAERSRWRVGVLRSVTGPVAASPAAAPADTSTAAAMSGLDAQGRHTGVAADLVQEVAQRLGLVVQLQPFDSEAAMLEALRAGRVDALPLLEHTPQRTQGLVFSLPWLELPQVLVGADSGPLYWGLDSLRGRRLAVATGHPQRAELQRLYPGLQLVDAADGAAALTAVQQGQADAALDIKPVVQQQLGRAAGQGLRVLGDVAEFAARYRVAVPEAQRRLLPLLDAALTDIDDHEKQRSLRRWLVHEPVAPRVWWKKNPWWPALLAAAALVFALLAGWGWWRVWQQPVPRRAVRGLDGQSATTNTEATGAGALSVAADSGTALPSEVSAATTTTSTTAAADHHRDMHLETWLQSVVLPHHRQAQAHGLRLEWTVDEVLPKRIHSDPVRLSQLLDLLLARAVAQVLPQGARGRLAFKASRAKLDNGQPALQLAVKASLPADGQAAAQDRQLVAAQALAQALGGHLVLRSRDGVGQSVSVRVPMRGARRQLADLAASAASVAPSAAAPG